MISAEVSRKYFLIFISFQITLFVIVLGFIGIVTWSQLRANNFVPHKTNLNLTIDRNYNLRHLEVPQRNEISSFVMTKPENNLARSAIRRTWGKVIKPLFVMSRNSENFKISLENESKVFGDMIVLDETSEISNNEKLFIALNFFNENFNSTDYFMLTRDDEFINPKNLYESLNQEDEVEIIRREFSVFGHNRDNEISLLIMPGNKKLMILITVNARVDK